MVLRPPAMWLFGHRVTAHDTHAFDAPSTARRGVKIRRRGCIASTTIAAMSYRVGTRFGHWLGSSPYRPRNVSWKTPIRGLSGHHGRGPTLFEVLETPDVLLMRLVTMAHGGSQSSCSAHTHVAGDEQPRRRATLARRAAAAQGSEASRRLVVGRQRPSRIRTAVIETPERAILAEETSSPHAIGDPHSQPATRR